MFWWLFYFPICQSTQLLRSHMNSFPHVSILIFLLNFVSIFIFLCCSIEDSTGDSQVGYADYGAYSGKRMCN